MAAENAFSTFVHNMVGEFIRGGYFFFGREGDLELFLLFILKVNAFDDMAAGS